MAKIEFKVTPGIASMLAETRLCQRRHGGSTYGWEKSDEPCDICPATRAESAGPVQPPDLPLILSQVQGRAGLTAKAPRPDRARYVWSMARFHTGVNVNLGGPIMASYLVEGDPWRDVLDALSEVVARAITGCRSVGRSRWNAAMTGVESCEPHAPSTAFLGGPEKL